MSLKQMSNCRIAILGDLHAGARNASIPLCNFQLEVLTEELIPWMEKHKVDTILQLGDLFDSRKFTNHYIIHAWKQRFFDVLQEKNIKLITILGNHDIASKNTLEVNSTKLFLEAYKNITIIDAPKDYTICGTKFFLTPWICEENANDLMTSIDSSDAIFCAGHFEFNGFEFHKGQLASGGMKHSLFDKFDIVFSGHYHTRGEKDNVRYVGTPYEMTWIDFDDPKGWHIFDLNSHKATFVKTSKQMFHKVEYDDKDKDPIKIKSLSDLYVKVIVLNKTDPAKFEEFITNIISQNPLDLKIIDINDSFDDVELNENIDVQDTKDLVSKFIDQVDTDLDKEEIKTIMNRLYIDSLEITT